MKFEENKLSLPWTQTLKQLKLSTAVNIAQAVVIIGLIILLVVLIPLKETVPVFVTFKDGSSNFVKIEAVGVKARGEKQLIRYFLRNYVIARETVDKATEKDRPGFKGRYSKVWSMSSESVKQAFKSLYLDEKTGLFFRAKFKRSVQILTDNEIGQGVHLLEIETIDTLDGELEQTRQGWTVTLTYTFSDQKTNYENGLLNPLGLFITEYSIQKKK